MNASGFRRAQALLRLVGTGLILAAALTVGAVHAAAGDGHGGAGARDSGHHAHVHARHMRAAAFGVPVHHCRSIISDKADQLGLPADERPTRDLQPPPAAHTQPDIAIPRGLAAPAFAVIVDPPPKRPSVVLATGRLRL